MKFIGVMSIFAVLLAGCGPEGAPRGEELVCNVAQKPWTSPQHPSGSELVTEHYRIFTTVSSNHALLCSMPAFMEASYRNYLSLTGLADRELSEKLVVYLMSAREEWASLTKQIVGSQSNLYLSIEAGGYCYQGVCVFWDLGGYTTLSVAAHEGLHQFLSKRLADQLPMWVEEGLCTTAEGYEFYGGRVLFTPGRNVFRFSHLRWALINGPWLPASKLIGMDAGDVVGGVSETALAYYGQLWILMQFIQSSPAYREGLHRLMADAQAGKFHEELGMSAQELARLRAGGRSYNRSIGPKIFEHYITADLTKFDREYLQYAKNQAKLK